MEITFYRKLANKVADAVVKNGEYSEADAKRINYGLVCIFSDLYKFILMLIVFSLFSLLKEYLLAFIAVLFLRPVIGGYHAKSEPVCIIVSFITMILSIVVGRMNLIPDFIEIILFVLLPLIGVVIAPVRTKKVDENTRNYKILAAVLTPLLLFLDYFFIPGQIVEFSVICTYLLTLYQFFKNKIIFGT